MEAASSHPRTHARDTRLIAPHSPRCQSVVAIRCDTMCKAIRGIGVAGGDPVAPGMISKAMTSGSFVHDDGATQVFDFGVPPPMWRSGRET